MNEYFTHIPFIRIHHIQFTDRVTADVDLCLWVCSSEFRRYILFSLFEETMIECGNRFLYPYHVFYMYFFFQFSERF